MRYFIIGWLLVICTGCSVPAKQPTLHDFGRTLAGSTHQAKATINVNAPTWLWDNRIRYRQLFTSPSEIRFYGLDRWIAALPELLEQYFAISSSNLDYALLIRLQDFEQQFDSPDLARVVLRFSVDAYAVDDKQKLMTETFYLEQPTKTPDAAGAINGFTDLTRQAEQKIQAWLTRLSNHRD